VIFRCQDNDSKCPIHTVTLNFYHPYCCITPELAVSFISLSVKEFQVCCWVAAHRLFMCFSSEHCSFGYNWSWYAKVSLKSEPQYWIVYLAPIANWYHYWCQIKWHILIEKSYANHFLKTETVAWSKKCQADPSTHDTHFAPHTIATNVTMECPPKLHSSISIGNWSFCFQASAGHE
jgi:hypothetical protein